jgi:hypothetical protein
MVFNGFLSAKVIAHLQELFCESAGLGKSEVFPMGGKRLNAVTGRG